MKKISKIILCVIGGIISCISFIISVGIAESSCGFVSWKIEFIFLISLLGMFTSPVVVYLLYRDKISEKLSSAVL